MLTNVYVTAERQKIWDSHRNQLNEYREANHGDYPQWPSQLYDWVNQQRREFGPLVDANGNLKSNVKVGAPQKQRIDILKSDGFVFVLDPHKQALVNQAVIKFSIIDGLFVKEYSSTREAAHQNNIKNIYCVS